MTDFFYFIADIFQVTFKIIPLVGDYINWLYIFIISAFLIVWISKMIIHKKNGEEHATL
tara:strand:- start:250 stop:426 length:177 start_codon:yes stop_codon:yes gene_type:complete